MASVAAAPAAPCGASPTTSPERLLATTMPAAETSAARPTSYGRTPAICSCTVDSDTSTPATPTTAPPTWTGEVSEVIRTSSPPTSYP
jgi:hypothetical protein